MVVEDEDVTPQSMDTGGVHSCILGKEMMEEVMKKRNMGGIVRCQTDL